jgi:hypothetical protein
MSWRKAINLIANRKGFDVWISNNVFSDDDYYAKCNICGHKFMKADIADISSNTKVLNRIDGAFQTLQAHGLMHLKEHSLLVFI